MKESVPDEEKVQPMRENTYVRVRGTVRSFGGKKSIVASKITPVTDMNELTYHILEVVHSHVTVGTGHAAVRYQASFFLIEFLTDQGICFTNTSV